MAVQRKTGRRPEWGTLCLFLGLAIAFAAPLAVWAGAWERERVDAPPLYSQMGPRSLAIDGQGRPHLAYGGDHLYYAWRDGSVWHQEVVDASPGVGQHTSLALDPSGNPHISYYDAYKRALRYATRVGGVWDTTLVDEDGAVGQYSAIALSPVDGLVRIAYYDADHSAVKQATRKTEGDWDIDVVDGKQSRDVGEYVSLAIDAAGHSHLSYFDRGNASLAYATYDGGDWLKKEIALHEGSNATIGRYTCIALDARGAPHIVSQDYANHGLYYAYRTGTAWECESVPVARSILVVGGYLSLAIDAEGAAHVSWYESHNGGLWYSYRRPEGASWASPMLVDDMGDAGRYSAIGVHEGTVHITHLSGDTRQLRHAVWDGAAWQHEVVGQTLAEGQVLAVDLDAYGHAKLIAHDPTSGALTYLFQDDQGWYREIVAASGVTEGHADMVVTPQGALIAYYDEGTQGLYLAERDATGWQRQLVDAAADVGRYCSLGVSYLDRDEDFVWERNLHISYYDATSKRLKYAHHDPQEHAPGEWALQVVDDAGDVGRYASLVVDTHGDPHISYYCEDLGDLRYAQFDHVAGWITGTLDTEFDRGKYTRMTLAADGWPCIVYHHDDAEAIDETPTPGPSPTPTTGPSPTPTRRQSRLRFAHVAGSRWYTEEVGAYLTVPEVAGIEELVVAKAGAQAARPCILYRERVTGPLKVACQSGTEWTFSTLVDNPSALGPSAALADEWNDDLVLGYSLDGVVRISRTYGISPLLGVPGAALVPIRRDEPIVLSARDASQRDAGASGPSLGEGAAFMGEHASIAIDSAGRVHVAYQDVSRADLRYAWRDEGGAWHREIVDREGLAGDYASLMLDPTTGAPRIAYCVDAALRYAQRDTAAPDEGQWRAETVTQTVPDAVTHTSLALDALGRPRVAYHSRASIYGARLRYASWDGGAWNIVTPTLPVSATGGLYASLVLDGSGRPHIAHYDAHSDGLLYTHYDGGGWTSAQVVTGTLVGAYCDIALDAADRPHISAHGGKTLYHAWLEGDTWRIESDLDAEAEGIVGTHTSIAIAEDGALHIAYYDEEQARLKHAQRAPGEDWEIDVIDAAGDVGRYASLVCGTGGMLHVAYAGTSDGDCLYARYLPDAPTPTPTATVTPTSTPSPTPPGVPLYLPLVLSAAAP